MPLPRNSLTERTRELLLRLDGPQKLMLTTTTDALVMLWSVLLATWFQYGSSGYQRDVVTYAVASALALPLLSISLGLYRVVVRHINASAAVRIALCCALTAAPLPFTALKAGESLHHALGFWFLTFCMATLGLIGVRLGMKRWLIGRKNTSNLRVAIYGAGAAGRQLAGALRRGGELEPVAFLDDDQRLHRREIDGLIAIDPSSAEVTKRLKKLDCDEVLICIPSISRQQRRQIVQRLREWPFRLKTAPNLSALMSGKANIDDIQEVALEDLLGRDPVPPNQLLLDRCVRGKVVLISGAGGSIGSELCRQIVKLGVAHLLLLDHAEFSLYSIHRELQAASPNPATRLTPLLASVTDKARMEQIFSTWQVDTVYHAAAYKHVPLVQHNPVQGLQNNVLGTQMIVGAAARHHVKHFTLISTDKAVRPTNFMGASKRLSELVVQAAQIEYPNTVFSMVRFGNVLGSSGSVIPVFKEQIAHGGPVTVTHPEITRFFMTIGEAVELVIQAGAMASGGDVYVLDMGQPYRIYDLARRIIQYAGRTVRDATNPDGDIEIQFTGLRPGEKLYEELLIGAAVEGTEHPKIMRAFESLLQPDVLIAGLAELQSDMDRHDIGAITRTIGNFVAGFRPLQADADWVAQEQRHLRQPLPANLRLQ